MSRRNREPDWEGLLEDWDRNSSGFDRHRSEKFELILDLLEAVGQDKLTVLDLGSGPGALAREILLRFPGASVVAVDYSPLSLRIGEMALARFVDRVRWVHADLRSPGWETLLPVKRAHVAVSAYSLHAHTPPELRRLYRSIAKTLVKGGMFINADLMEWGSGQRAFNELSNKVLEIRRRRAPRRLELSRLKAARTRLEFQVRKDPYLRRLLAEEKRERTLDPQTPRRTNLDTHLRLLRTAGFSHASVMWQYRKIRVLVALR